MPAISSFLTKLHRHNLSLGYYPGSMRSALIFVPLVAGYSYWSANYLPDKTNESLLSNLLPHSFQVNAETHAITHMITGLEVWLFLCLIRKWLLKNLLRYQGWMHEGKKPSIKTKMFFLIIRILNGWSIPISKKVYGCQGILPSLPVPNLKSSVHEYLASMKPLMDQESYTGLVEKSNTFLTTSGPKLQLLLRLKSWFVPNYISDWWETHVYLRGRSSLLTTNYSQLSVGDQSVRSNHKTVATAALIVYHVLKFRESIEGEKLPPLLGQGMIPFCSWQYERMFNTCRIPGEEVDTLVHQTFSDHIVCRHRGRYFKIHVYKPKHRKVLLSPAEFQLQFQRILADDSEPAEGEDRLFTLTAWDRNNWAKTRNKYFKNGVNKISLDAIEQSAFVINLEENLPDRVTGGKYETPVLLDGPFWYDKSMSLCIYENQVRTNMEHSWGDGTVVSRLGDMCNSSGNCYKSIDEDGYIISNIETTIQYPKPKRLNWDFPKDCIEVILKADKAFSSTSYELEFKSIDFSNFGKGSIKRIDTSPDAFVQMALQLAYFRVVKDQGKFGLTYESSSTQLFLKGRTETVRSCSEESCEWVRSMESVQDKGQQKSSFRAACLKHQNSFRQSCTGGGCDRHIFGLFVLAKYLDIDSPFLNEAISSPWLLSTSQTPTFTTEVFKGRYAGTFAPASAEGYGVSYMFCGQDRIYFQVSSNRSSSITDSARMASAIEQALLDIQDLFL